MIQRKLWRCRHVMSCVSFELCLGVQQRIQFTVVCESTSRIYISWGIVVRCDTPHLLRVFWYILFFLFGVIQYGKSVCCGLVAGKKDVLVALMFQQTTREYTSAEKGGTVAVVKRVCAEAGAITDSTVTSFIVTVQFGARSYQDGLADGGEDSIKIMPYSRSNNDEKIWLCTACAPFACCSKNSVEESGYCRPISFLF